MVPYATLTCEATEQSWLKYRILLCRTAPPTYLGRYIKAPSNADSSGNQSAAWMTGHGTRIRRTRAYCAAACAHRKDGFAPPTLSWVGKDACRVPKGQFRGLRLSPLPIFLHTYLHYLPKVGSPGNL
ncbi:hypothetical protein CSHISOI_06395 [Colletotrichum shisoi]|uniref:Uncharacterized protein n=1 Tax=Colletotrichum shisoi TaxID=2078593 RepID=A0A5Q4BPZ2_9PEZI|nr:hypothetical protein CSHISOI_06395 [Colletotrichum shisoi]